MFPPGLQIIIWVRGLGSAGKCEVCRRPRAHCGTYPHLQNDYFYMFISFWVPCVPV